jgi:hypothetical protein
VPPWDVTSLGIFGPTNTIRYINTLRHFVAKKAQKISIDEYPYLTNASPTPSYVDENLQVTPFVIKSSAEKVPATAGDDPSPLKPDDLYQFDKAFSQYVYSLRTPRNNKRTYQQSQENAKGGDMLSDMSSEAMSAYKHQSANIARTLPSVKANSQCVCYLIKGPKYDGKFNAEKAKEASVPNDIRSRLVKGQDVETPEGKIWKSSDFVDPPSAGKVRAKSIVNRSHQF